MTAADELDEAGFQVLEAKNADEALVLLEAHSDEVQVLFTDVDMPGSMDGMALAERVYQRWPHVLLLISSGHARPHPDEIPDHGRFVPKVVAARLILPTGTNIGIRIIDLWLSGAGIATPNRPASRLKSWRLTVPS